MTLQKMITGLLLFITSINIAVFSNDAQPESDEKKDPVIAVVLAGGGALGFAHVGVLKVLEEEGIHPDIVIGSSMGSIVGSLYSVGYRPTEIEKIIEETNWNETLNDSFVRKYQSFDRKQTEADYILSYGRSVEDRTSNSGFSHAQHIVELLDKLLVPNSFECDFDTLPIRFRAVATDLQTGEMIVYRDGDLKTAVRASMSVPSVFTPVKYKGRYAIDGGWSENLPTVLAEEMGADIIIAVSLFSLKESLSDLNSLGEVTDQAYQIRTIEKLNQSLDYADLVIAPDLSGYTMADFEKGKPLMALGYEAASKMRGDIRDIKKMQGESRGPVERISGNKSVVIANVAVDTEGDIRAQNILEEKIKDELGSETTILDLQNFLYSIYDSGDFTHLWYQLVPAGEDEYTLIVDAPGQTQYKDLFGAALDFSGQIMESSITSFTFKTNYQKWFGQDLGNSLNFELWLSEFPSAKISFNNHILSSDLLLTAKAYVNQTAQYFFEDDSVESIYSLNKVGGRFGLSFPFWRKMNFSLGMYGEYLGMGFRSGVRKFELESSGQFGLENIIYLDTLNRIVTPEQGLRAIVLLDGAIDTHGELLFQSKMAFDGYFSPFKGFIVNPRLEVQTLFLGDPHPVELPTLGSAMIVHGYYLQELRAKNVAMAGLNIRKKIFRFPMVLGNEIYLQLAVNAAVKRDTELFNKEDDLDLLLGGSVGIIGNSRLGEVQLNFGINKDGRFSTYLGLSTSTSFYNRY